MNALNELTCLELVDLVTEYFEGTLPAPQRLRFEEHLSRCRHCQVYIEQMRRTMGSARTLQAGELPRHVRDELLRAFRSWKREGDGGDGGEGGDGRDGGDGGL